MGSGLHDVARKLSVAAAPCGQGRQLGLSTPKRVAGGRFRQAIRGICNRGAISGQHTSMSSLADLPDLVGFFSYSRKDDEDSEAALSKLRARIQKELRLQLGRSLRLWQDATAIPSGTLWEDEINRAIAESVFFIPIVTPSVVASKYCRFEFEAFLKRERELGRGDLVFPILYIRVAALENEDQWRRDELLTIIAARQYVDWQKFRHRDVASTEVAEKIEEFCRNIFDALHKPWLSPQERQARGAIEATERTDEAVRRDGAEEPHHQHELEAGRRVEEKRRRREAAEGLRKLDGHGTHQEIRSDSRGDFRFSSSLENVLLGGGIGGAVTGLLLGVYYYLQFGPSDESVTWTLIAEMLVAGAVMGIVLGFCIQVVILWFRYLVSSKRRSAALFNDVTGGAVGGAIGGLPVGILAGLVFGFRYREFIGIAPMVIGTSVGVLFVAAGALFHDYDGRWQNVARAFTASLLMIVCIATIEIVVLQVTNIEQWVYVEGTGSKLAGAIVGVAIFLAAGLQVGLTLAVYRLWKTPEP
jgi:TIR domain-containing protein